MNRTPGMNPRWTLIAILVGVELTIINVAREGLSGGWSGTRVDAHVSSRVAEDGPHRRFPAGEHPALTVNIGYADLKIVATDAPTIDVSVASSASFGMFGGSRPITATATGDTVNVVSGGGASLGDDRLVTILVPARTPITVINAGDITVSGMRGDATIKSIGSGSVRVDDYKGSSLRVASKGPITLHSVSAAHLDAASSDDKVDASELAVRDGSVESDDRVTLAFAPDADTIVRAVADDGKINTVGFVDTADSVAGKKDDDDDDLSTRTVQVGNGNGHFDVHASDGSITLEK